MGLLGRLMGRKDQPVMSAPSQEVQTSLFLARDWVEKELPHCSNAEKREMTAMRCSKVLGWGVHGHELDSPYAAAYIAMSHAWFVTGMVLQRDRVAEVREAMKLRKWQELLGLCELAAWASKQKPFKDEFAVDAFCAEVWARLGLPAHDRPSPNLIP